MYPEHHFVFAGWHDQLRRDVDPWTVDELAAGLRQLSGLRAALDACEARLLARFDTVQGWKATGAADAAGWLRDQTGTSAREAAGRVRTASGLADLPEVADALADGMITHAHAAALARAAARTPEVAEHQGELLRRAVGQSADAFDKTVHSWERRVAADGGASQAERQHARRSVTSKTVDDGMTLLQARLDPIAAATVTTALDRIAEELWRADTSGDGARVLDLHVRRADALVEMAKRAMAADPNSAKRPEPSVVVLIDHLTLAGQIATAGVCELIDGAPIAPDTVRRVACTAGILPVVLDGKSRPLDLGTSQRYASAAQRLALTVRDRGCVFPGCDRPHTICDAHHLLEHPVGPTNLENLALVCEAHHHLVHEGGWRLQRLDDGGWLARSPTGVERIRPPGGRERLPDPPAPPDQVDQPDQPDRIGDAEQLDLLAS
jgi:Domain of unknown function (DUF222)